MFYVYLSFLSLPSFVRDYCYTEIGMFFLCIFSYFCYTQMSQYVWYDIILYVHNCTQMASHTIFLFYYIFTYYSVFIHSATLETFRLFPVFPGMNYLVHIYLNVGVSLEDLSRCGITEFQELYIFTLIRDGQVSSLNDCSEDIPPNTVWAFLIFHTSQTG